MQVDKLRSAQIRIQSPIRSIVNDYIQELKFEFNLLLEDLQISEYRSWNSNLIPIEFEKQPHSERAKP